MESREGAKLDTKGDCLLCLASEDTHRIQSGEGELLSIRYLFRHLEVPPLKENAVDLCKSCEKTLIGFTTVFEELERAQMKMNYFLEKIHALISGPEKDSRMHAYPQRVPHDGNSLAQVAFVNNLRKKLAVKSLEKRSGPIPSVILMRGESELKKESAEDMIEADNLDFRSGDEQFLFDPLLQPQDSVGVEVEVFPTTSTNHNALENNDLQNSKKVKARLHFCKTCGKTFPNRFNLLRHNESVHLKQRYECDRCNAIYAHLFRLKKHKETCKIPWVESLPKNVEKYICKCGCGKKFSSQMALLNHRENDHAKRCEFCDKKFSFLHNLQRHVDAVHLGKVHICRFCNKKVAYKGYLQKHEKKCKWKGKIKPEVEEIVTGDI